MPKELHPEQEKWLALGHGGRKDPINTWRWWYKNPSKNSRRYIIAAPNNLAEFHQHRKVIYYQGEYLLEGKSNWDATWKAVAYFYSHILRTLPPPPLKD